ncbi:peptidase M28, partial [Enterococcus durans]|nr:peptidase M28 [Enterococcus durans]
MDKKEEKLLIDLTSAKGVPGNEEEVRKVYKNYAKEFADDIFYDGLGSIIAKHGAGGGPKVFISGH